MNRHALARGALVALLAVAVALAYLERQRLDADALEAWIEGAGALGPLSYMALYAAATILFVPGAVLTLAGGVLFGPVMGALYSLTGATLGATGAYFIARFLVADWVARKAQGRLQDIIRGVEGEGWRFVAFVRLVPLFPFNLTNYMLGLTRIPPTQFIVASFVCMAPGAFVYSYIGYLGHEVIAGGDDLAGKILIAVALLAGAAFLPRLLRRLRAPPGQLNAADLARRLAEGEDIAVLDVRSTEDYSGDLGHVSGSLSIPLAQLSQRLPELEALRGRAVAVICRTNRMSSKAAELLRGAGFRNILVVSDGMLAWHRVKAR